MPFKPVTPLESTMPSEPVVFLESAVSSEPLMPLMTSWVFISSFQQAMMVTNAFGCVESNAGHKSALMPVKRLVPRWCSVPVTPTMFRIPL
eukprot:346246-Alexandrium_andersonii.AAC.1